MSNLAAVHFFQRIKTNATNYISYYDGHKRIVRSFAELSADIDICVQKLRALNIPNKVVALSGPTSYSWMVLDLACIKGGYHSVAIPETFSNADVKHILSET